MKFLTYSLILFSLMFTLSCAPSEAHGWHGGWGGGWHHGGWGGWHGGYWGGGGWGRPFFGLNIGSPYYGNPYGAYGSPYPYYSPYVRPPINVYGSYW